MSEETDMKTKRNNYALTELARVSVPLEVLSKERVAAFGIAIKQLALALGATTPAIQSDVSDGWANATIFTLNEENEPHPLTQSHGDACHDCGRSCDGYRCDECEDVHRDATSCPTCRCPNTGGDICDGCDDINREEAADNE